MKQCMTMLSLAINVIFVLTELEQDVLDREWYISTFYVGVAKKGAKNYCTHNSQNNSVSTKDRLR